MIGSEIKPSSLWCNEGALLWRVSTPLKSDKPRVYSRTRGRNSVSQGPFCGTHKRFREFGRVRLFCQEGSPHFGFLEVYGRGVDHTTRLTIRSEKSRSWGIFRVRNGNTGSEDRWLRLRIQEKSAPPKIPTRPRFLPARSLLNPFLGWSDG